MTQHSNTSEPRWDVKTDRSTLVRMVVAFGVYGMWVVFLIFLAATRTGPY